MSLSQTPLEWSVVGFYSSTRNTNSELTVICNGKRFVLRLVADNLSESPKLKERYLFFLRVAEEFELDGFTVEDLWDWAAEPLFPFSGNYPSRQDASIDPRRLFQPRNFCLYLASSLR
ncbi:Protein kinase domain-containing protein [Fusarium falciforme]|uniref:Protein kinase domain-containing protein n=1 Tax=Fusarium falciforme TaxID=195108 RepID=UPI002301A37D|nr:Protein kinase domain-containing protein [Fusarium falciforme]WAO87262.1 Protein kinase domain-containing protein [Fusarium falciforme]